jgi:predicted regulator of Ras-like GTPase activity (Roadblock/LC7/MglB family)
VDAAQALADLTEISSQIQAAALFDEEGRIVGSTLADEARAAELVRSAGELLAAAEALRTSEGELIQLEASTLEGSVFVVRDGARRIVATTGPEPTVGLVFYDLKSCLRGVDDGGANGAKRGGGARRRKKGENGDGEGSAA